MNRTWTIAISLFALTFSGDVNGGAYPGHQKDPPAEKTPSPDKSSAPQELSLLEEAMRNVDIRKGRLLPEGRSGVVTIFQSTGGWGLGRSYFILLYDDGYLRLEGLSKTKGERAQVRHLDPDAYIALASHVRALDNKSCSGLSDAGSTTYRLLTREEEIFVFRYGCDLDDMNSEIVRLLSLEPFVGKGGTPGWMMKEEQ